MKRPPLTYKMLRLLLRPLVKLLIRHGHGFSEAMEALRAEFIDVAVNNLKIQGHEVNISRLSAVTGIGRREVSKVLKSPINVTNQATLTARVLGTWEQGSNFLDKNGKPKKLTTNGKGSEFFSLVESVSKDINPYTMLFELERTQSILRNPDDSIELAKKEFVIQKAPDSGIELLSGDLSDFLTAVDENIFLNEDVPNLHLKTEYTNVKLSAIKEIETWLVKNGSEFHSKAREFISRFDVDLYPDTYQQTGVKKDIAGIRVALGTFSRIEKPKEDLTT